MAIVLRTVTGSALTHTQVDTNFASFYYSSSLTGQILTLFTTGSTAIGQAPTSTSFTIPSASKWTDMTGGGITRNSFVSITGSFAQGHSSNIATGANSHAQGRTATAAESNSHAEGEGTVASGPASHAEGNSTSASAYAAHAEGIFTIASGYASHAEGVNTTASQTGSHAEGNQTTASGNYSHAEGSVTVASGLFSHAEGTLTTAFGEGSHAEGVSTQAIGNHSHAEGLGTIAVGNYQHVQGRHNITSSAESAFIIGNGVNSSNKNNLVFASGSTFQITGSLLVTSSIILKGTQTITGSLNILGTQTVNGAMVFTNTSTLNTPDILGNSTTNDLTIQGNQGLILTETNGNVGGVVIGTTTNTVAYNNQTRNFVTLGKNWNAVSGSYNLTMNALHVNNSINLVSSSGTNIVRGVYINPTLTGVSDYRAIETTTGSVIFKGPTTITGSLSIASGSDFYYGANKQYNYGAFQNNTTLSGSANVSQSFQLDTLDEAIGVSVVSGSRVTFANNGTYNMQFSAQLDTPTAATVYIWFKKNGVNIPESGTKIITANNTSDVPAWNFVKSFSAGDYVELAWQSTQTNTVFPTIPASGNIPICPSIIFTATQIR